MIPVRVMPELRAAIAAAERRIPESERGSALTRRHASTIRTAPLWWANEDMTRLAVDTSLTMPAWTPMIARPSPVGLMAWSAPIGGFHDAAPGFDFDGPCSDTLGSSRVRAAHWSIDGEYITFTLYGTVHDQQERERTAPIWHDWYEIGVYTTYATHEFTPGMQELADQQMGNILHVIGASWLLMQQPTIATMRRAKPTGRGAARKPKKIDTVQVIDLRRLATNRLDGHDSESEGREYRHRWLVRGHWRQQRVGPGRKYVKPVYVAPHIKGPDGAPLKTERVHAWRR